MMGIAADYEQKKADYKRLKELCEGNYTYDFCGAWCNNDVLDSLMENPTKKNAMQHYSSLITRYFRSGFDNGYETKEIDVHHPEVYEILQRNFDV
jgi:hypothetical protein